MKYSDLRSPLIYRSGPQEARRCDDALEAFIRGGTDERCGSRASRSRSRTEPGAPGAALASQDARRFGRDVHGRCSAFRDVKARRPCSRMARARLYTTDRDFSRFAALRTMNPLDETRSRRERLFTRSRLHCTKSGEGGIRTPG